MQSTRQVRRFPISSTATATLPVCSMSWATVSVDNNLVASHDPAATDANHVFTLENGMLKVEAPDNSGSSVDYALNAGTLSINPGFTGTIAAEYVFTTAPTREIEFKYDHNGLRTQKKVTENGVTTTYDYTLHGKLITHLTKRTVDLAGIEAVEELHFFYDTQSRPAFVEYNGVKYRYVHNLQGDIVGIVDSAGNLVVEYKYDAWGKLLSTTGSLADTLGMRNPFRYRGYVYDEESELYYLRSRYYCPVWGRFINADELLYGKLLSNVFSYCLNRPVIKIDITGRSAVAVTGIGGWLASGGWAAVVGAAKAVGAFVIKAAAAGAAALGLTKIAQSAASSNADERTDVQPAPGPAPTTKPSTSPAPKTTPNPNATPRIPDYPGDDPKVAPEGYQWRGRGEQGSPQGNYHNPDTGESLHPDLDHKPPVGPHWDYWGPDGVKIRIFPPN